MTGAAAEEERLVRSRLNDLLAAHDPATTPPVEFWGAQYDLGLAWVRFPPGCGGLGVGPALQVVVDETLRDAGAATNYFRNPLGVGMAAPTLIAVGTEEQRQRWLRPAFTCEEVWCQLFSEPGAGSDLASLSCRAERDAAGDWVVTGQKAWTTLAHRARWGLLLARTDPDAPKHHGITYFVLDMHQPGVEVRPVRQLTGDAEFNEVFLTGARVPDAHRLGEMGDGWRVAMGTLMTERVSIGGAVLPRGGGPIGDAVRIWRERPDHPPALRDRLLQLWVEAEVTRLTNLRAQQRQHAGIPGPEGSTAKVTFAELNQRIYDLCLDLLGPAGMLYPGYEMTQPEEAGWNEREVHRAFLRSRGNSIEGGTSEILRNILAERVLGLPR
jgi:alkylation response protein AidB-like acyl-CoA dehydrogenase